MKWVVSLAIGLCLSSAVVRPAAAQSTIFNSPTTDTLARRTVYIELDQLHQMPGPDEGPGSHTLTPRVVFGASSRLEAGVNLSSTMAAGATSSLLEPNVKYKLAAEDREVIAAAAGVVWYVPINHRDVSRPFGLIYAAFSKKVRDGPRFTVGPYVVAAGQGAFAGARGGLLAGYEQPVSARVSLVADWFSGRNALGYFTPGISMRLSRSGVLSVGYSVGNDSFEDPSIGHRALFAYFGFSVLPGTPAH